MYGITCGQAPVLAFGIRLALADGTTIEPELLPNGVYVSVVGGELPPITVEALDRGGARLAAIAHSGTSDLLRRRLRDRERGP